MTNVKQIKQKIELIEEEIADLQEDLYELEAEYRKARAKEKPEQLNAKTYLQAKDQVRRIEEYKSKYPDRYQRDLEFGMGFAIIKSEDDFIYDEAAYEYVRKYEEQMQIKPKRNLP